MMMFRSVIHGSFKKIKNAKEQAYVVWGLRMRLRDDPLPCLDSPGLNYRRNPSTFVKNQMLSNPMTSSMMKMKIEFLLNPDPTTLPELPKSELNWPTLQTLQCHTCGSHFRTRKDLTRHIKTLHPDSDAKWYHCPNSGCTKKFIRKDALQSHLKSRRAMYNQCKPLGSLLFTIHREDVSSATKSSTDESESLE